MKWLTRSHVHVDRVACPWLISRFVDSDAEFLYVPASQIERVAKETGAIPFDAPGVELGHKDGRCSFESIILKYELKDPALLRMAKSSMPPTWPRISTPTRSRVAWRPSPSATACASQRTPRTWPTSSRCTMPSMPGAGCRLPRASK